MMIIIKILLKNNYNILLDELNYYSIIIFQVYSYLNIKCPDYHHFYTYLHMVWLKFSKVRNKNSQISQLKKLR